MSSIYVPIPYAYFHENPAKRCSIESHSDSFATQVFYPMLLYGGPPLVIIPTH